MTFTFFNCAWRIFKFENRFVCGKDHKQQFYVPCQTHLVYRIVLPCRSVYIGQTKRCLNIRLKEHFSNIQNGSQGSELASHLETCGNCTLADLDLGATQVVFSKVQDPTKRLLLEALTMDLDESAGKNVISRRSLQLSRPARSWWW